MGSRSHFLIFVVNLIIFINVCNGNGLDDQVLCNATENARVQYQFTSDIVRSEHIVTFRGYYSRSTRENYVGAAMKNAGVSIIFYNSSHNNIYYTLWL